MRTAVLCLLGVVLWIKDSAAQPGFNYQARLSDSSGAPLGGVHTLYFGIFKGGDNATSGSGSLQFAESVASNISNGVVNHAVGTGVNLFGGALSPAMFSSSPPTYVEVSLDSPENVLLPRTRLEHAPLALRSMEADNASLLNNQPGSSYAAAGHEHHGVYVPVNSSAYFIAETSTTALASGVNLLAAYARAKTLTPGGQPPSAANRCVLLVSPGTYDMAATQLTLDAQYVDVVGLSSSPRNQYIFGMSGGAGTGVLRQTANDVHIANLLVQCTRSSGGVSGLASDPAAYFPDSDLPLTQVRNCEFRGDGVINCYSTRAAIVYSGSYSNCAGEDYAFGYMGTASGVFTNCEGGLAAFGGNGNAIGTFTGCKALSSSFGGFGLASGSFTDCTGGDQAFGGLADATGAFTNCTGGGISFGGGGGVASGTFINCAGGSASFGGDGGDTAGAKLVSCRTTGESIFATVFSGRMENCNWATGFTCAPAARIYASTILGTLDLNSAATGVTQTRALNIVNGGNNIFGATNATALNVSSASVN